MILIFSFKSEKKPAKWLQLGMYRWNSIPPSNLILLNLLIDIFTNVGVALLHETIQNETVLFSLSAINTKYFQACADQTGSFFFLFFFNKNKLCWLLRVDHQELIYWYCK